MYNKPADDSPTEAQVGESRMEQDSPLEDVNPEYYVSGVACYKVGKYFLPRYVRLGTNRKGGRKVFRMAVGETNKKTGKVSRNYLT